MDLSGLMKAFGGRKVRRKVTVSESYEMLIAEEADKLLDDDAVKATALEAVQQSGIVFIDEIDKVATRSEAQGADVSRQGVQRDLLPLVEGTAVSTKYGVVRTDHILFIAAGAFHVSKPSDMIPELQGRFPIRVELKSLSIEDFIRILKEPKNALCKQYEALLETEGIKLVLTEDALAEVARLSQSILDASLPASGGDTKATSHGKNMLKTLVQGGKFDPKTKKVVPVTPALGFADMLWAEIKGSVVDWATGEGSFVVVALTEAEGFAKKSEVLKALKKEKKKLEAAAGPAKGKDADAKPKKGKKGEKKEDAAPRGNAGARILLEKL